MPVIKFTSDSSQYDASPIESSKIISGSPIQELSNVFTNVRENFFCGVWRSTKGIWTIAYTEDEFCILTRGLVILTETDGDAVIIKAGDAFTIPAGYKGTWETVEDCEKYYAIYEDSEQHSEHQTFP